ncbi:hypothetical protein FRB90_003399 [Tulasnella sp. 427]|nr:hypothetical protein FRB90_003399 [Tulasnella sp. 427]
MSSHPPSDHVPRSGRFGPPTLTTVSSGGRRTATYDGGLQPFSALQHPASPPVPGSSTSVAATTHVGTPSPSFHATSFLGAGGHPQSAFNAPSMPATATYYPGHPGLQLQTPSTSSASAASIGFGHPAMAMAPSMGPMSFFAGTSSSSNLPVMSPAALDAASVQSNWQRRVSASRPSRARGKGRARGPANPAPTLGDIPTFASVLLECTVVVEFYPWVNSPGEKRKDVFIYTERQAEFRSRQNTFGALHVLSTVDLSCPISTLFDLILRKMTTEPFYYRFEDLEEITARDGASLWERLPFFILVPTNKGTPRPTTGAIHLDLLPEFKPLTLGGLTEAKKIKDAAKHAIWEQSGETTSFILRIAPKVPFTARSATAFTTSVQSTVHQHTCIKDRMEYCLTTNNVQEGLPTYRKAQGTDYLFDAGDLSSNPESIAKATRARRGEATYTTLASDRERPGLPIPTARRQVEPFPMDIASSSDSDSVEAIIGSSRERRLVNATPEMRRGTAQMNNLPPPQATSEPAQAETYEDEVSTVDMEIDVPLELSPVANNVAALPPSDDSAASSTFDLGRLFEVDPPAWKELFPYLPRALNLYDLGELISSEAELGIDLRAGSVEALATKFEATIHEAIKARDFTRILARRAFFVVQNGLGGTVACGKGPRNQALSHLLEIHLPASSGYFVPASSGYRMIAPASSSLEASLLTSQHCSQLEFLGAIHALSLAWLGRAPLGFSPFHMLHLAYSGNLAAMSQGFMEKFDPETYTLVKDFRSRDSVQALGEEPWRSRFIHHFGISPIFITQVPQDPVEAERWSNKLELMLVTTLTLGSAAGGPETQSFNQGFQLPCKNGFKLTAAISRYDRGIEGFIQDTWGGLITSYESIAARLRFKLVVAQVGPTLDVLRNQLRELHPNYRTDHWMGIRDTIIDQLKSYFKRALSHPSDRFKKGLRRLVSDGLCKPFDDFELSNPGFFARQFHIAARATPLTLGKGLGDITVSFVYDLSTDCCSHGGIEFSTCSGEVEIPIPELINFLTIDIYKEGSEITSGHDAVDWFILQSILTQTTDYGKL